MFYDSCFRNKKLRHSQAKIISRVNLILVIRCSLVIIFLSNAEDNAIAQAQLNVKVSRKFIFAQSDVSYQVFS